MSILIAEDNPVQRRYLSEILAREFPSHAPIIETENGDAAIKSAIENRPSLCILDIQMPETSGVKAARVIWRDFPEARIIFWTQFPPEV
jgi:DNA-binding NarL/FixJ family response regulator